MENPNDSGRPGDDSVRMSLEELQEIERGRLAREAAEKRRKAEEEEARRAAEEKRAQQEAEKLARQRRADEESAQAQAETERRSEEERRARIAAEARAQAEAAAGLPELHAEVTRLKKRWPKSVTVAVALGFAILAIFLGVSAYRADEEARTAAQTLRSERAAHLLKIATDQADFERALSELRTRNAGLDEKITALQTQLARANAAAEELRADLKSYKKRLDKSRSSRRGSKDRASGRRTAGSDVRVGNDPLEGIK